MATAEYRTYTKKKCSDTPFASSPEEADEFIESQIKDYFDTVVSSDDVKVQLNSDYTSANCTVAFVRHVTLLYEKNESEERIKRDVEKIWNTYIAYAKRIKIFDHNDEAQWKNSGGLLNMKTLAESAASLRDINLNLQFDQLEQDEDGQVRFTQEFLKDLPEDKCKEEENLHPLLGFKLDNVKKAVDALNPPIPGEISPLSGKLGPTPDTGNNGFVLDKLTALIEAFPGPDDEPTDVKDPNTFTKVREWWSINAFAANIYASDNLSHGVKRAAWPLNMAVKIIRYALEEERSFESNTPGEPSIGPLAGAVVIWLESAVGTTLVFEAQKVIEISLTSVAPGELAKIKFQEHHMTMKRLKFWKSRCKEIQELSSNKQQNTTVKESSSGLKFWKKDKKKDKDANQGVLSQRSQISRRTAHISLGNALKVIDPSF